jgi:hypothetical protein
MSIPNKPPVVRPVSAELNQFVQKLANSSDNFGATSQIHADKTREGKIIFSRASAQNKEAGTVSEHLKLTVQRQVARDEIKRMLKDSGIELTDDIKKAMPSLTRSGDANSLQQILQSAISQQDKLHAQYNNTLSNIKIAEATKVDIDIDHTKPNEVKAGFKRELEATNFDSGKVGIYLRNNSKVAKALTLMFSAAFKPMASSCAKAASDATLKSLTEKKDPDSAMKDGYQALLSSLSTIVLPDEFKAMCVDMAEQIDKSSAEAIQKEPGRAAEITKVANTFKKTIVSSLFLRVLTNQITITLASSQKDMNEIAAEKGVKLKETTLLQRLAPPLLALINGAEKQEKNTGKDAKVYDEHPEFKSFVTSAENNLVDFTAYQALNAQLMATNSIATNSSNN